MRLFACSTLVLTFSTLCSCNLRVNLRNGSKDDNRRVWECLESLIDVMDWAVSDFLVIFDNTTDVDDDFLKRYPDFVWKIHSAGDTNFTGFSNVILFTENFHTLNVTLSALSIRQIDSRAKIVIIVTEDFATLNEIRTASIGTSAEMWKLDKTRVIYLVPCKGDILAMTYFPFAKNCQVGDLEVLDVWRGNDFEKGVQLFPEKMLDIRGCIQNHSAIFRPSISLHIRKEFTETGEIIFGGVGGRLMTIVAAKMNMKLHLLRDPEDSDLLRHQITQGESLFSVGGHIPTPRRRPFFDMDYGYMKESYTFGYMASGFEFSWKNFVYSLSTEVWSYIGCTSLLFCSLIFLANRLHRRNIIPDEFRLLDSFGMFLGSGRVLPRSDIGRYLIGMWIVYSYLINTSYNSGLVGFLTAPNEKRVLNTFKDVLDDGLDFVGDSFNREFFNDRSDPVMMEVYNNYKVRSLDESDRLLVSGKASTGIFASYLHLYNSNQTGNRQLRMLEEKVLTYQLPVFMRRGSPFVFGVHHYASQAVQSGLVQYWLQYYTRTPGSSRIRDQAPTVISIQHLRGILYLYTAGLIFSSMVFVGELIYHKYSLKRDL